MKKMTIGFIAGLMIGMPVTGHAAQTWKKYKGLQTGEVIVCQKKKGTLAVEKDIHKIKGKTYTVAWCNGKNW